MPGEDLLEELANAEVAEVDKTAVAPVADADKTADTIPPVVDGKPITSDDKGEKAKELVVATPKPETSDEKIAKLERAVGGLKNALQQTRGDKKTLKAEIAKQQTEIDKLKQGQIVIPPNPLDGLDPETPLTAGLVKKLGEYNEALRRSEELKSPLLESPEVQEKKRIWDESMATAKADPDKATDFDAVLKIAASDVLRNPLAKVALDQSEDPVGDLYKHGLFLQSKGVKPKEQTPSIPTKKPIITNTAGGSPGSKPLEQMTLTEKYNHYLEEEKRKAGIK